MADAGLFIGWGEVVRGREDRALDVFNETIEFYGQLQSDGRIEDFEVALLDPHGGELLGYAMLRGSEDQIDAVRRDEDFQRLMTKASLDRRRPGDHPGVDRRGAGARDVDLPGGARGSALSARG